MIETEKKKVGGKEREINKKKNPRKYISQFEKLVIPKSNAYYMLLLS